jgi:hypothetical protein
MNKIKTWQKILIVIATVFTVAYLYNTFKPQSKKEIILRCLELGSNDKANACLRLYGFPELSDVGKVDNLPKFKLPPKRKLELP